MYTTKNANNNNNAQTLHLPDNVSSITAIQAIHAKLATNKTVSSQQFEIIKDINQQIIFKYTTNNDLKIVIELNSFGQIIRIEGPIIKNNIYEIEHIFDDEEYIKEYIALLELEKNDDFINCYFQVVNVEVMNDIPNNIQNETMTITIHEILKDEQQDDPDIQTFLKLLSQKIEFAEKQNILHYAVQSEDQFEIDKDYPLYLIREADGHCGIYYAKITDEKRKFEGAFGDIYPAVKLVLSQNDAGEFKINRPKEDHKKKYPSSRFVAKKLKSKLNRSDSIFYQHISKIMPEEFSFVHLIDNMLLMNRSDHFDLLDIIDAFHSNIAANDYPKNEALLFEILNQLFDILCRLHENDIVHTDIKPDNILVSKSRKNEASIVLAPCDFDSSYIKNVTLSPGGGTRAYISPTKYKEMLKNENLLFSFKDDVFALGITLYMLLTNDFLLSDAEIIYLLEYLEGYQILLQHQDRYSKENYVKIQQQLIQAVEQTINTLETLMLKRLTSLKTKKMNKIFPSLDKTTRDDLYSIIEGMLKLDENERLTAKNAKVQFDKIHESYIKQRGKKSYNYNALIQQHFLTQNENNNNNNNEESTFNQQYNNCSNYLQI